MQYPTYLKTTVAELPPLNRGDSRYVVAANGIFLERHTAMFTTATRVYQTDLNLADQLQYCRLHIPTLPAAMVRAMLGFFKFAHEIHGGEAALVLLYDPERTLFRWHCPVQTVEVFPTSTGWVASDCIEFRQPFNLPEGYLHFGDAHLHPGSPGPSAIDIHDDQDGLHIIVGDIIQKPSYHIDFVMDGVRFHLPPEMVLDGLDCQPFERLPASWPRQIRIRRRVRAKYDAGKSVESPT